MIVSSRSDSDTDLEEIEPSSLCSGREEQLSVKPIYLAPTSSTSLGEPSTSFIIESSSSSIPLGVKLSVDESPKPLSTPYVMQPSSSSTEPATAIPSTPVLKSILKPPSNITHKRFDPCMNKRIIITRFYLS